MPITANDLATLQDGNVVSASGDKIGSIGQIYLDDQTGEPTFVTANTGLFGMSQSFVPLQGARVQDRDLVVDYDKETVKDAPRIDDDGSLSPAEEDQLYAYYGLGGVGTTTDGYDTRTTDAAGTATDTGYASDRDADTGAKDRRYLSGRTTDAGYDTGTDETDDRTDAGDQTRTTSGTETPVSDSTYDEDTDRTAQDTPRTDADFDRDADRGTVGSETITLSGEGESVESQPQEMGRARLRKYVVTETVTIPVQREEVRLEQEPMTSGTSADEPTGSEDLRRDDVDSGVGQDRPDRRDV